MGSVMPQVNFPNNKCPFCGIDTELNNKLEHHSPSCEYRKYKTLKIEKLEPRFDFHDWVDD